jgi:hypothetical protein
MSILKFQFIHIQVSSYLKGQTFRKVVDCFCSHYARFDLISNKMVCKGIEGNNSCMDGK